MATVRKGGIWITAIALALGSVAVTSALAHTDSGSGNVTIEYNNGTKNFTGSVISNRKRCKKHRQVILKKKLGKHPWKIVGRDHTNKSGGWTVFRAHRLHGKFRAVIRKKVKTRYGHRHVCRADNSNVLQVK